ncbi:MAG: nucleotidyl transferase AbiEii/AbiGii toxin family protein [Gammaproteobacteria bacterium]
MIDFTGYGLIHRFSEDIDIHIRTNFGLTIEGKEDKPQVRAARKKFYDVLANSLSINGITEVKRDYDFDDTEKYRSGGIRLYYQSQTTTLEGLKDGILLEAGFDTITPNKPINISSWVWEHLVSINASSSFIDNTAIEVQCYHPGYTLVEKLQTIVRKYRNKDNPGSSDEKNFIRQYYDVYCLLGNSEIQEFIGSPEYLAHKAVRIKGADNLIPLNEHPSLLLNDLKLRESFINRYLSTSKLYYNGQPDFEDILARIAVHVNRF